MFGPWIGNIPWRRAWQPTPVFLPGESHGQRSLEGYSPWAHRRGGNGLAYKQQQQHAVSGVRQSDSVAHIHVSILFMGSH